MNTKVVVSQGESVLDRLERRPELMAIMGRLLDVIENASGDVKLADEAERRVIDEVRLMGQEVMSRWGQRLADEEALGTEAAGGVVRQSKKNSIGYARLAKSRLKSRPI